MNFDSFFFRSPPARSSFLVSLLSLSLSLARALARFLSLLLLQQQQQQERQRARRDSRCGEHQGKEREREKQRERERETWGMPKTRRRPFFSLPSSPAATQLVEEKPPLLPPPVASSPILRPTPLPFFFPSQSSHDSRQMERSFTFRAVLTFSGEKQHYPQIHFCRPPHRPRFPQDPAPLVPQSLSWLPADIAARHFYPFDSLFPLPILTIQRAKVVQ